MSKNNGKASGDGRKPAPPPEETTAPPEEVTAPPPAIDPPGRVGTNGHGLAEPADKAKSGVPRLRSLLKVSGDVSVERLCDDAAVEIERLREAAAKR